MPSMIDSAIERARQALSGLRVDAGRHAADARTRAGDRAARWQRSLHGATEHPRRKLGIRAVRAQRSRDALDAMSDRVKKRKKALG